MGLNAKNVRQAITGALYHDPTREAPAPTGTASPTTEYDDLGYLDQGGVTLGMPGEGETKPIKVWQGGATVRVVRLPSEDQPTLKFRLVETKLETIEFAFGVTVEQGATEGSFIVNTNKLRDPGRIIFDVVDGDEFFRIWAPNAIVTELAEIAFNNDEDGIGYDVTVSCDYDDDLGGQLKVWSTALKSGE